MHADPALTHIEFIFTDDGCDSEVSNPNYWLPFEGGASSGKGFTLDFGCDIDIAEFELRNTNTQNRCQTLNMLDTMHPCVSFKFFFSSMKQFRIDVSESGMEHWTTAVTGELPDPIQFTNCGEVPLSKFRPLGGIATGRFVKLVALDYYGSGAGLHYFNVVQYDKREGIDIFFKMAREPEMTICETLAQVTTVNPS